MNTPIHQPFGKFGGYQKHPSFYFFSQEKKDAKALAEEWLTGLAPDVGDLVLVGSDLAELSAKVQICT